jgi:hypothetical protein
MSAGHEHSHTPANFNKAFAIGIGLNITFVAIEAFYGWKINSLALHRGCRAQPERRGWSGAGLGRCTGRPAATQPPSHLRLEEG